jgi:hypothetical protein
MAKLHSESVRPTNTNTVISLRELTNDLHKPVFAIEVGRVAADTYEPQRVIVDRRGLLTIYELIKNIEPRLLEAEKIIAAQKAPAKS